MKTTTRICAFALSGFLGIIAIGLLIHEEHLKTIWIWPEAPWIADAFMCSVIFANATTYFYSAFTKSYRSLLAVSIASLVAYLGAASYLLSQLTSSGSYDAGDFPRLLSSGKVCIIFAIISFLFILNSLPFISAEKRDKLPSVLSFFLQAVIFITLYTGINLIFNISPFAWGVTAEMAVIYGWAISSTGVLIATNLILSSWKAMEAFLWSFILYDLIMAYALIQLMVSPRGIKVDTLRLSAYLVLVVITLVVSSFYLISRKFKDSNS